MMHSPYADRRWPNCRPGYDDLRFRELVRHLHRLGPRPVGELLIEVVPDRQMLMDRLKDFAVLNPGLIVAAGAYDWLPPKTVMRAVP